MSRKGEAPSNTFLKVKKENSDLNQYWYSAKTIEALVKEIQECGAKRIAFLSTPSLYFSLTDEELKKNSYVFDYDEAWNVPDQKVNYVKYDFNHPFTTLPPSLYHTFDMVVVDPPFITEEVWVLYAIAMRLLLLKDKQKGDKDDTDDDNKEGSRTQSGDDDDNDDDDVVELMKIKQQLTGVHDSLDTTNKKEKEKEKIIPTTTATTTNTSSDNGGNNTNTINFNNNNNKSSEDRVIGTGFTSFSDLLSSLDNLDANSNPFNYNNKNKINNNSNNTKITSTGNNSSNTSNTNNNSNNNSNNHTPIKAIVNDCHKGRIITPPSCPKNKKNKILISSINENTNLFIKLFNAKSIKYKPSIPNLVYQYNLFANYHTTNLDYPNPEIDT